MHEGPHSRAATAMAGMAQRLLGGLVALDRRYTAHCASLQRGVGNGGGRCESIQCTLSFFTNKRHTVQSRKHRCLQGIDAHSPRPRVCEVRVPKTEATTKGERAM